MNLIYDKIGPLLQIIFVFLILKTYLKIYSQFFESIKYSKQSLIKVFIINTNYSKKVLSTHTE